MVDHALAIDGHSEQLIGRVVATLGHKQAVVRECEEGVVRRSARTRLELQTSDARVGRVKADAVVRTITRISREPSRMKHIVGPGRRHRVHTLRRHCRLAECTSRPPFLRARDVVHDTVGEQVRRRLAIQHVTEPVSAQCAEIDLGGLSEVQVTDDVVPGVSSGMVPRADEQVTCRAGVGRSKLLESRPVVQRAGQAVIVGSAHREHWRRDSGDLVVRGVIPIPRRPDVRGLHECAQRGIVGNAECFTRSPHRPPILDCGVDLLHPQSVVAARHCVDRLAPHDCPPLCVVEVGDAPSGNVDGHCERCRRRSRCDRRVTGSEHQPLVLACVGAAVEHHPAVTPWLLGNPLDEVITVLGIMDRRGEITFRVAAPAHIADHVREASAWEVLTLRMSRLDRVRRQLHDRRHAPREGAWLVHRHIEPHAVSHRNAMPSHTDSVRRAEVNLGAARDRHGHSSDSIGSS